MSDNGQKQEEREEDKKTEPTDFKLAEIWLKNGKIFIEAPETFWMDKCRALGLLEYCKDIVKEARVKEDKRIIPAKGGFFQNIRSHLRRR